MTEQAINGFGKRVNALEVDFAKHQGMMGERVDGHRQRLESHQQDIEELFTRTNDLRVLVEQTINRVAKTVSVWVGVVTGVLLLLFTIANALIFRN